eukprot:TRINITY_DN12987_c0_g1_i1.p1 TRINITY_DN12987_c0_g1~~TRINITY_DN12987_c0_g1_i1.p1  ORF type:complete len:117 (-),score=15.71 TRINITY_DN12987_c0_g1_i1:179-529(-)
MVRVFGFQVSFVQLAGSLLLINAAVLFFYFHKFEADVEDIPASQILKADWAYFLFSSHLASDINFVTVMIVLKPPQTMTQPSIFVKMPSFSGVPHLIENVGLSEHGIGQFAKVEEI